MIFDRGVGVYFYYSYGFAGNISLADSQIYICDFHRGQAWERFLTKSSNGLTDRKQSVLAKLRAVARARTETRRVPRAIG